MATAGEDACTTQVSVPSIVDSQVAGQQNNESLAAFGRLGLKG